MKKLILLILLLLIPTLVFADGVGVISYKADCSAEIEKGKICVDTDDNLVYRGNGSTVDILNQLGTLTNTKWCTTNGTIISCTEEAPAAAMTVGGAVASGTANSVPFINAGINLAQDNANFSFDDDTNILTVGGVATVGSDPKVTLNNVDGPASPAAGDLWVDTSGSLGQVGFYDAAVGVLDPRRDFNFSIGSIATSATDRFIMKPSMGMTILSINCIVDTTTATMDIQECDSAGADCATILTAPVACDTDNQAASVADASIAAGNWVYLDLVSVTSATKLSFTISYTVTAE